MSKSHQNYSEYFPKLNFNYLQRYAKRWVDIYKKKKITIKSIKLYRYSYKYKLSKHVKYALVFELDKKISEKKYEKFEAKLAYLSIDDAEDQKDIEELADELAIDANFDEVYNEKPENNYLSEWQFLSRISGKKMPKEIIIKDPYWILYPVKDCSTDAIKVDESKRAISKSYSSELSVEKEADMHIQNKPTEGFLKSIDPSIKDKENVFKRVGKNWFIKYRGKFSTFPDHEKIRYIVYLLDNPSVELHSFDLKNAVKKENIREKIVKQSDAIESSEEDLKKLFEKELNEKELNEKGLSLTDLEIDRLTKEQKDKFEEVACEIYERLKDAEKKNNQRARDRAKKDLENFRKYLLNEYGIRTMISRREIKFSRQLHRAGPEIEKVRKSVTKQINKAIKDIEKEIPSFAQYLRKHIKTGKHCIYRLDDRKVIDWHITW